MTWEQLMGKIREGLTESGARVRVVGEFMTKTVKGGGFLRGEEAGRMLTLLVLAVSDLHSVVEHLAIGLDAVVGVHREADKSQEVKGE